MKFTPEELAEMAAADAEIEKDFSLTREERISANERDREAKRENKTARQRYNSAYYLAHKEARKAYKKGVG